MLTDQTFLPRPLVVVGPEVFATPVKGTGTFMVRTDVLSIIRQTIIPCGLVNLVYAGNAHSAFDHDAITKALTAMDIRFSSYWIINDEHEFNQILPLLETALAVCSPELATVYFATYKQKYTYGELHFARYLGAYLKAALEAPLMEIGKEDFSVFVSSIIGLSLVTNKTRAL